METVTLRKQILPILLFCQAKKGDLSCFDEWKEQKDAGKKLFYAYYSGLFCRILVLLDSEDNNLSSLDECSTLLQKYNWYDIQKQDLKLFSEPGAYGCEIPEALAFMDGVDNVGWKDSGFSNGRDAVCLKMESGSWTFADVRGSCRNV